MAATTLLRLLSLSGSPRPSQDTRPRPRPFPPLHAWPARRRRLSAARCASSPTPLPPSLDLPLLPFQRAELKGVFLGEKPRKASPTMLLGDSSFRGFRMIGYLRSRAEKLALPKCPNKEVLIPSESKTLHLYEARYIALLEEAMYKRENSFVHFVLDPVVDSSPKASFAVRYGCLVQIESVQKLEIGALVSIRGVCRVNISNLLQMEPYFRGAVSAMMDEPYEGIELSTRISKLRESMCSLHNLQMKLKVPEDEPLQTNIRASLLWSEKEIFEEYNKSFIPGFPERLSFAAYQSVSGMSDAELLTLQENKIQAMDSTNTLERLNNGIEYVEHNIGMIAARLAIQNI